MLEINNTTKHRIDVSEINLITEAFLKAYKMPKAYVSVAVVGPARMRRLNRDYRRQDKTTDVLSFPASSSSSDQPGRVYIGELIINKEEADKVSKYQTMLTELELPSFRSLKAAQKYIFNFLLVHGLLHLVGYDDSEPDERLEMLILGRDFLKKVL